MGRLHDAWRRLTATQLLAGSFLVLILLGTIGFRTLPGLYTGEPLSWLDALFTATSAVCVTGLIVVDTATYFTTWGQAYVLLLIQLGGLGIVTLSTLVIVVLGRRLSLRQETLSGTGTDLTPWVDYRGLTRSILRFTLGLEAIGAVVLFILWVPRFGLTDGAWHAVFHAISAFCNAGFSTFTRSLIGFREAPATLIVIMTLIVLGGLGFLTLEEFAIFRRQRRAARRGEAPRRRGNFRLTLHSRLALSATAVLILFGWGVLGALEWDLSLAGLGLADKLVNSLFLSVTPRTAGFQNIDYVNASDATNLYTMLLMFVGGSPGSTAGGIKTTTLALLVVLAWSRFRGSTVVSAFGRSVPEEIVQRATGLFVFVLAALMLAMFALILIELGGVPHSVSGGAYTAFVFEVVSAMNTVGLSLGVTGDLSDPGKVAIILLMYLGRIGPLTFAAALALPRRRGEFRYAHEEVVVG